MRALAAVAVLVAVIAGCSNGPGPLPSLAPEPTRTFAPSPESTGAAVNIGAVVRDLVRVIDTGLITGDLDALRARTAADCPCRRYVDRLTRSTRDGRHYRGVQLVPDEIRPVRVGIGFARVLLRFTRTAGALVDAAGRPLANVRARGGQTVLLDLELHDGVWVMVGVRGRGDIAR
jgi:hypothetical protein